MTPSLHSFDVFDTLLTRAVGMPTSVFLLMGRLPEVVRLTGCGAEEWARVRMAAEQRSRRGRPETTLRRVYDEIAVSLCLTPDEARTLEDLEVALERRLCRPVPLAVDMIKAVVDSRRVAVSDMYLPTEVVRTLLADQGLADLFDDLLVSSDHDATKSNGQLFSRLLQGHDVDAHDVRHVGDNAGSDVRVPRLLGLGAEHATAASLNRYELLWEEARWATSGLSSLFAGASRLARLSVEATPADRPIVDVAAGVAAPILTAYVLWLLNSAQQEGVRRLYFLARDGEVLHLIAQKLVARLGLDIELRYLYGSRSVYHRAALAAKPLAEATWAWKAMYGLTIGQVLERLGLDDTQAHAALSRLSARSDAKVQPALIDRLVADQQTVEAVRTNATELRDTLQAYLRQEGFCDGTRYAIVDTGWAGRIVQALSDVLPEDAEPIRRGWFFGYMKRNDGYSDPQVLRGYLFDEVADTGYAGDFEQAYGPVETFTVANHGMTVGFVRNGDRVEAVLAGETNPTLDDWPWELFREALFRFVDELVLDRDIAALRADLRPAVAAVLAEFWLHPTRDEATAWGRYVYEDDILAASRNHLASPMTPGDFLHKTTKRSYEGKRLWLPGSVALTPAYLRPQARFGLWMNDRLRTRGRARFLVPDRVAHRGGLLRLALSTRRHRRRG